MRTNKTSFPSIGEDDSKRCERCGNHISTVLKNMLSIKSGPDLEQAHLMKLVFQKYQEGRPIEQKCNGDRYS